ncbi:MAG: lipoyl(octanoyl) transferase LipB [Candidatus Firestonebacteria bacterium]
MNVLQLGLIPYKEAFNKQLLFVKKRIQGEIPDTLLLLEHPPVITLGRSGKKENILNAKDIEILEANRGGDVTCHFPGQIVGYPILDLSNRKKDIHKYMRDLEEVLINFLKHYGLQGLRIEGKTGVFVNKDKIASIGIAVKQWVSYHGFAVNIKKDLSVFESIIPCGLKGVKAISLEHLTGRTIDMKEAFEKIGQEFVKVFA